MKITYASKNRGGAYSRYRVFIDGKLVGEIRESKLGWQYFPRGTRIGGNVYPSLAACQHSLETDEDCVPQGMTEEEKTELRLDQADDAERGETLEQERERVFGACGGKCGEAPCILWNQKRARRDAHRYRFATPKGYSAIERGVAMHAAIGEWLQATHAVADALKESLSGYVYGEGFVGDDLHQLKALVGARDRKYETFLATVAE